ncbi:Molybdopterin molybdenumtransferase [Flavobacterium sp. 9R]|uniref:molybdopterin molybdotransferase MoeA n=1 Tax=Flavobacterium sp. 9R TaxID=2653143 RepID=UPI0012F1ABC4|nr:gephyrin-like molybdotransferase Glp [Flavobacterium sp. 9R]VXC12638.1 Molybdopterin molybdenumtransferase [Flavobacterium sp. 9R]
MITVSEAFSILKNNIPTPQEENSALLEARKKTLSQSILSPIHMPPFRQSAMDGYAVGIHDKLTYQIIGEIKAGDAESFILKPGQAVKIFTGAPVPDTAQAMIPIEKVTVTQSVLTVQSVPKLEDNIRPIGEQIKKGELALEKGTELDAAAIGFLAALGITTVPVFKKPSVGIVVTGNELLTPGTPLTYGKVYESNGIMLEAALMDAFFQEVARYTVKDDFESTKNALQTSIEKHDVILVSGGISVGDYDFVAQALQELEVKTLFHKVNQKPGKPLFAGKVNEKMIFALPGNPAACLTCFYVYVLPTLKRISGQITQYEARNSLPLEHHLSVNNSRAQFLKAKITNGKVAILSHQASSMLNTFSTANALVYVVDGNYDLKENELVTVYGVKN